MALQKQLEEEGIDPPGSTRPSHWRTLCSLVHKSHFSFLASGTERQ